MKIMPSVWAAIAALAVHASSSAGVVALEWTTGGLAGVSGQTRGYAFDLSSDVNVSGLGYFDDNGDGLASSHQVGIWNSAGTLLMSATVSAGTVDALTGHFRFTTAISGATALAAGSYVVAGLSTANDPIRAALDLADVILAPQVSFIENRTNNVGNVFSFANATQAGIDVGTFGGNFMFNTVPEPASLLLVLSAAGAGLWAGRRRT